MKVGMIGLGAMGRNVAMNIRRAGFELTVHDIRPDACAPLVERGARIAADPAGVLERSDVVITMVFGPKEIEQVLRGPTASLDRLPRKVLDRSDDQQPQADAGPRGAISC